MLVSSGYKLGVNTTYGVNFHYALSANRKSSLDDVVNLCTSCFQSCKSTEACPADLNIEARGADAGFPHAEGKFNETWSAGHQVKEWQQALGTTKETEGPIHSGSSWPAGMSTWLTLSCPHLVMWCTEREQDLLVGCGSKFPVAIHLSPLSTEYIKLGPHCFPYVIAFQDMTYFHHQSTVISCMSWSP